MDGTWMVIFAIILVIAFLYLSKGQRCEKFVAGEDAYMEPEFNDRFEACLQAYPIPFRGPINSGWYGCLRQVSDSLIRPSYGKQCRR